VPWARRAWPTRLAQKFNQFLKKHFGISPHAFCDSVLAAQQLVLHEDATKHTCSLGTSEFPAPWLRTKKYGTKRQLPPDFSVINHFTAAHTWRCMNRKLQQERF
jgi:hypothetical protein